MIANGASVAGAFPALAVCGDGFVRGVMRHMIRAQGDAIDSMSGGGPLGSFGGLLQT